MAAVIGPEPLSVFFFGATAHSNQFATPIGMDLRKGGKNIGR
jgi:hypothetical protein